MLTVNDARRLVFLGKQQVAHESFDPGAPAAAEVRIQTRLSLMSTGTENIVFNRLFDSGTHWDNWVKYPFYPGYAAVGVVEAVGPGVETLRVGDRVAFRVGHCSHAVVKAAACFPIPASVPFDQAVWFSLAKIGFHGARAAAASHRIPLAKAGGATATVTASIGQAREAILQAGAGKLPRVVVDTTGNAEVFAAALSLVRDRGTVVVLGDTGQPTKQTLSSDFIVRGLTLVGAHDMHNTAEWTDATITQLFFSLVASGRFPLAGLNSHVFKPEQCDEAYATANRNRATTMGIVFDWTRNAVNPPHAHG